MSDRPLPPNTYHQITSQPNRGSDLWNSNQLEVLFCSSSILSFSGLVYIYMIVTYTPFFDLFLATYKLKVSAQGHLRWIMSTIV